MLLRIFAIIIPIILAFIVGYLSIESGEYGWTIFTVIPFIIGYLPPYIAGRKNGISKIDSFGLSFLTLAIALICLLIFAIEGLICILMALPIFAVLVALGSYLGYLTNKGKWLNSTNSTIGMIVLCFFSMSFDIFYESNHLIPVKTNIMVDAPIKKVWQNVVTFNKIDAPKDWIFKTGISCPTDATIIGKGVGAIRYCNFTTGSFVEPITTWHEPELLQFDVIEQPIPMNEFNPFRDIQPQHLQGYFVSKKGQFKLTKISEHSTELEGTTFYQLDILPQQYWQLWSDFIIHKIHERVLNHIKNESEK